ncbi:uncharacterized protein LOC123969168 [Micropterus dolomieu]|uniref:uncharacterized protein LOC123969168 n=1 Tax=Micropterus dolomieu TaxID=147949 RepID=UPI001E8DECC4|nr:uncharacterized protein LOC123969168 [Micropterus dolomieu]
MGYVPRPVHRIHIQSDLVTGFFPVAVCDALPIQSIVLLLGNDIAGGKVTPTLEVLDSPLCGKFPTDNLSSSVFPACVLTRARTRLLQDECDSSDVSLNDSVLMPMFSGETEVVGTKEQADVQPLPEAVESQDPPGSDSLPVTRGRLANAQRRSYTAALFQKCAFHRVNVPY